MDLMSDLFLAGIARQDRRGWRSCECTPKAFANFSSGLERASDNPGIT